jgi:uncharacterized protein
MKCPVCSVDLMIADRQGIDIDYCPKCRGIWLDRGELDKVMERSAMVMAQNYGREYLEERAYQTLPVHHQNQHQP